MFLKRLKQTFLLSHLEKKAAASRCLECRGTTGSDLTLSSTVGTATRIARPRRQTLPFFWSSPVGATLRRGSLPLNFSSPTFNLSATPPPPSPNPSLAHPSPPSPFLPHSPPLQSASFSVGSNQDVTIETGVTMETVGCSSGGGGAHTRTH